MALRMLAMSGILEDCKQKHSKVKDWILEDGKDLEKMASG